MLQRMAGLRNIEKLFDFDDTDDSGSSVCENESSDDETEDIEVYEEPSRVVYLEPEANLSSLVDSLNQLGVTAKDMISILQALKEAGSLIGTIEVL